METCPRATSSSVNSSDMSVTLAPIAPEPGIFRCFLGEPLLTAVRECREADALGQEGSSGSRRTGPS